VFVVRFAALASVVIVVGGSSLALASLIRADAVQLLEWIVAAAGLLVIVSLFVMKFVGPPPQSFVPRAALAFALTAAGTLTTVLPFILPTAQAYVPSMASLLWAELALGIALLTWYAREHAG
jgi:hypothetical protein